MNRLESKYEAYLRDLQRLGHVEWFAYEPLKLKLADKTYYTPDFIVMRPDGAIEVHDTKGTTSVQRESGARVKKPFIEEHSAIKIKACADKFPFRFFAVWLLDGVWQYSEYGESTHAGRVVVEVRSTESEAT
jgi:hypothetical protein